MTGQLNEHPLAELIREIAAEELSGSLRLERAPVKTVVYFEGGLLLFAASNHRLHRLADSLKRWRVLTDEQLALARGNTDAEVGASLVNGGVLKAETLEELRSRQAVDVLRAALLWTDGTWNFDARVRLNEAVRTSVEMPELLMEAARRLPQDFTARRFRDRNETLRPASGSTNTLDLLPKEAFVLSRIDAPISMRGLTAISGLQEEETLHACYSLALGGLIEREGWSRAWTPEEIEKVRAVASKITHVTPASSAAAQPKTPLPAEKKTAPAEDAKPEVDEKLEVEELFERVGRATNFYQILGVVRSADQDSIKRAYHTLARRFHPDRFHRDAELHARVENAFTEIAQAYETLRDRQKRATYDLKLERLREAGAHQQAAQTRAATHAPHSATGGGAGSQVSSMAQRAAESFQKGLHALKQGDHGLALASFAEAARIEPKNAQYRARYGRTLAARAELRHHAEGEIQAAIVLEPKDVSYRLMLAELYRDQGLVRRALAEVERALLLEPQHQDARRLLSELRSRPDAR